MKHFYLAFWLIFCTFSISAQTTVFLFDWEGTDPKEARIGPNAVSIGAGAFTKTRLDNQSKGLTAPTTANTKADFNMVLTDNPIFNQDGIDLSFDYQRDEGTATIFSRNNFRMGFDGMNVRYRVRQADGTCSAPISSTSEAIADDDTYRKYRFRYDPNEGNAVLSKDLVNGGSRTVIWTNPTKTPGQPLCWDGDGNITIGIAMDGSGKGNALLDNLRMEDVAFSSGLPVELTYFHAKPVGDEVDFVWQTASESDNEYFAIERSGQNTDWEEITRTPGQGNSNDIYVYEATDPDPLPGVNYYRLKQVDFDGKSGYSAIESITYISSDTEELLLYPNPTSGRVTAKTTVAAEHVRLFDTWGREVTALASPAKVSYRRVELDLSRLPVGVYYAQFGTTVRQVRKD